MSGGKVPTFPSDDLRMCRLPAGVILKGRVRVRLAARLALRTERAPVLVPRAALSRNV